MRSFIKAVVLTVATVTPAPGNFPQSYSETEILMAAGLSASAGVRPPLGAGTIANLALIQRSEDLSSDLATDTAGGAGKLALATSRSTSLSRPEH